MADPNDPVFVLLEQFRNLVLDGGLRDYEAYNFIREHSPLLLATVNARAREIGHIFPNQVGDRFIYRYELILAGLHNNSVRGICFANHGGIDVATCLVGKYPLHNFFREAENMNVIEYGGEGGQIAAAHQLNMRILEDQRFTDGNVALANCMPLGTTVRLVLSTLVDDALVAIDDGVLDYVFNGLYRVVIYAQDVTAQGFRVFRYILEQVDVQ